MEAIDEQLLQEEAPEVLTTKQIFSLIWTEPRRVLTFIHISKFDKYTTILVLLYSLTSAIQNFNNKYATSNFTTISLVLTGLFSIAFGFLILYIFAALLRWTGSWIGGLADTKDIFRVNAFTSIPGIVRLIFHFPTFLILVSGNTSFLYNNEGMSALSYVLSLGGIALVIWHLVLFVIGISVAQKFSVGKAVLNFVFVLALFFVPIVLLFLAFL